MERKVSRTWVLLVVVMCILAVESSAQMLHVRRVPSLRSSLTWRITAVSSGVLIGFDSMDRMVRSVDSGRRWTCVDTTIPYRVNEVRFVDHERGYAVCDSGMILRTDDSGLSWTRHIVTTNTTRMGRSVYPLSRDTVVALFRGARDTAELMRSDDAGESWSVITDLVEARALSTSTTNLGFVDALRCFDSQHWTLIWNSWGGNVLLRTTDAGRTWTYDPGHKVQLIELANDSVGFYIEDRNLTTNEIEFAKTTDAGATWTPIIIVPKSKNSRANLSGHWVKMNSHGYGVSVARFMSYGGVWGADIDGPLINPVEVHTTTDNWETWRAWPVEKPPIDGFISGCIDDEGVFTAIGIDNTVYRSHVEDDTLRLVALRLFDEIGDAIMISADTWIIRGSRYLDRHINWRRPRVFTNILARTTDAGESWSVRELNQQATTSLGVADVVNEKYYGDTIIRPKLEYADDRSQFVTVGTELLRTTDGGDSWASVYTHDVKLRSVSFGDGRTGFAVDSLMRLYRSMDSGSTFSRMPNHSFPVAAHHAVDAQLVFASDTGTIGKLRKTTDGGETWSVVDTEAQGAISSIDAYDENRIVVSRLFGTTQMYQPSLFVVPSTRNGGFSWTKTPVPVQGRPSLRYLAENTIVSVTKEFNDLSTCDGGLTWQDANIWASEYPRSGRSDVSMSNSVGGSCLVTGFSESVSPFAFGLRVISGCGAAVGVDETKTLDEVESIAVRRSSCEIISKDVFESQMARVDEPLVIADLQGRMIAHLDDIVVPRVLVVRTASRSRVVLVVP